MFFKGEFSKREEFRVKIVSKEEHDAWYKDFEKKIKEGNYGISTKYVDNLIVKYGITCGSRSSVYDLVGGYLGIYLLKNSKPDKIYLDDIDTLLSKVDKYSIYDNICKAAYQTPMSNDEFYKKFYPAPLRELPAHEEELSKEDQEILNGYNSEKNGIKDAIDPLLNPLPNNIKVSVIKELRKLDIDKIMDNMNEFVVVANLIADPNVFSAFPKELENYVDRVIAASNNLLDKTAIGNMIKSYIVKYVKSMADEEHKEKNEPITAAKNATIPVPVVDEDTDKIIPEIIQPINHSNNADWLKDICSKAYWPKGIDLIFDRNSLLAINNRKLMSSIAYRIGKAFANAEVIDKMNTFTGNTTVVFHLISCKNDKEFLLQSDIYTAGDGKQYITNFVFDNTGANFITSFAA